eukprot:snap_masked-scaffold_2-processed-gene-0.28-mRNA-1 protein AED:1.00 eAED:1.00 QI:0/-1/0/0/-1/1/1/0/399
MLINFIKSSLINLTKIRNEGAKKQFFLVFGNEAYDLDSQTCSLIFSYFLSRKYPNSYVLPIMNVAENEAQLRKDNFRLLENFGISKQDLIFIDQIPLADWSQLNTCNISIVDHNKLSPKQYFLSPRIKFVVDHHDDEKLFVEQAETFIRQYKSCATVLSKYLEFQDVEIINDPDVRKMMCSTILMDTDNLINPAEKIDREVYDFLLSKEEDQKISHEKYQNLHKVLVEARSDNSGLSPLEMMKKDLKYASDEKNRFLFSVASVKDKMPSLGVDGEEGEEDFMKTVSELLEEVDERTGRNLAGFYILMKRSSEKKRLICAVRNEDEENFGFLKRIQQMAEDGTQTNWALVKGKIDKKLEFDSTNSESEQVKNVSFLVISLNKPVSRKAVLPMLTIAYNNS